MKKRLEVMNHAIEGLVRRLDLPHVRYLKVSEGCDHGCAFCAIPLMRGRHRSFGVADVVREAQLLELQGARELNLVAQDLAHYGRDRRDAIGLPELLDALVAETSIPWIRLLYLYSMLFFVANLKYCNHVVSLL